MAVATHQQPGSASSAPGANRAADALVVFGITGNLAKVMTFRSLYRLEQPPAVHRYAPGTWGPTQADHLLAGVGSWLGPWVAS